MRDKNYVIDRKSTMFAKTGMAFNFQVGFQNLVDKTKAKNGNDKASHYSVIIADTVMVTEGVCLFFLLSFFNGSQSNFISVLCCYLIILAQSLEKLLFFVLFISFFCCCV